MLNLIVVWCVTEVKRMFCCKKFLFYSTDMEEKFIKKKKKNKKIVEIILHVLPTY